MTPSVAFLLMEAILKIVRESGANLTEAECAIAAAAAMLPVMDLRLKPTSELQISR